MSDDLLTQMTRALADEHDGATAVPEATRARVIRTLAERRPRRRKWLAVGIPAFVLFGGSTAWAAATGRLPQIVDRAIAVFVGEPTLDAPPEKPAEAVGLRGGRSVPPPQVEEPQAPLEDIQAPEEAPQVDEPQPEEQEPEEIPTQRSAPSAETNQPSKAPAVVEDPSLALYRKAHEAHFKQGNCEGAVQGYRIYLRQQPNGLFALEAKYNLGVCLARLGRNEEARPLLQQFAKGQHGDYRKTQAQELLDALGQ